MKRILLLSLLFGLLSSVALGQAVTREKLLKRKPSTVNKYDTTLRQSNQYFLMMDFAEAKINNPEEYADRESFILIADNYAPVRDMALLRKINKPVHVILCGTQAGYIHVEYLQIAYKTGGSVHTIEEDIENLTEMSEGAKLEIGGITYQIQRGKFVIVRGS